MEKLDQALRYTETTGDIKVTVQPEYLSDDSDPTNGRFAFSYTVTIENYGEDPVQLLRRHWLVNSGGVPFTEVEGEGVVGEQPALQGGEGFQYTSWSVIKDPMGSMRGKYTFKNTRGDLFDVTIPEFDLFCPDYMQ